MKSKPATAELTLALLEAIVENGDDSGNPEPMLCMISKAFSPKKYEKIGVFAQSTASFCKKIK
jgi:hypothetical protein